MFAEIKKGVEKIRKVERVKDKKRDRKCQKRALGQERLWLPSVSDHPWGHLKFNEPFGFILACTCTSKYLLIPKNARHQTSKNKKSFSLEIIASLTAAFFDFKGLASL